jgi:hypothetical protein
MSTRVKTTTDVHQDVAKKLKKARKTMLNRPIQYATLIADIYYTNERRKL